jgi:hypothetical protein
MGHRIAQLVLHGLVAPSFLPEKQRNEFRRLTRLCGTLLRQQSAMTRRVIKRAGNQWHQAGRRGRIGKNGRR